MRLINLLRRLESIQSAYVDMEVFIVGEYFGLTKEFEIVLESGPEGLALVLDEREEKNDPA